MANEEGNYEALNLVPGLYNIVVTNPGFKQFARIGIELHVGDSLDIPAPLEIGAVNETVMVTGAASLLETTNADVGQIVDNRRLNELPLPGGQRRLSSAALIWSRNLPSSPLPLQVQA